LSRLPPRPSSFRHFSPPPPSILAYPSIGGASCPASDGLDLAGPLFFSRNWFLLSTFGKLESSGPSPSPGSKSPEG
jgi:hypothetical protein